MTRVLIKDGYVITVDHCRSVHPGGFVLIDGSKIERVGGSAELPTEAVERTIDARGMAVIPGLINAHQHFYYLGTALSLLRTSPEGRYLSTRATCKSCARPGRPTRRC